MGLVKWLGVVCKELREEQGLAHSRIGYHLREGKGGSESALRKFESGETQPRGLDKVLKAYAEELDTDPITITKMATERWIASGNGSGLEPISTGSKRH